MNIFQYYLDDARDGLKRNFKAVFATILLIFISLSITSCLFIVKTSVDEVVEFLDSQVKIKVLLNSDYDVNEVNEIIERNSFVKSTTMETKEETLKRLEGFFEGKEHLFVAFKDSEFPNAITIELNDKSKMSAFAEELKEIKGIQDVIYPQEFAQTILSVSEKINTYGFIVLGIFLFSSFLTVSIAINLSMFQRQKEIRVKLLLGANEKHVKGQFIFEGSLIGFISSVFTCFVVYVFYDLVLYKLQLNYGFLFKFDSNVIDLTMIGVIVVGTLIGLVGSWISTRQLITNA